VLKLQPVREQHPADKTTGGDGEVALMEGHERTPRTHWEDVAWTRRQ
jgi:hypothetical protein